MKVGGASGAMSWMTCLKNLLYLGFSEVGRDEGWTLGEGGKGVGGGHGGRLSRSWWLEEVNAS